MSEKLVLIDGNSILNRAFYGVPDLTNSKGLHTNAVYGFLNILFKIIEEEKTDYLMVAFDVKAPTFRHEIYKEYKGTRKPMPDELREQLPIIKEVLKAMNIVTVEKAGLEADDILGTLAKRGESQGMEVSLVSGDRDLLQVATEHIKIRIPKTKGGKTEVEDYYAADVFEKYQVTPRQFIDLKALMGDTADNIPGVPKVGEKTATDLMITYGSLEGIYEHIEEITKKSIKASLQENKELADLSKVLATINVDSDIEASIEEAKIGNLFTQEAYKCFKELEFKNFLSRFEAGMTDNNEELLKNFKMVDELSEAEQIFEKAGKAKYCAIQVFCDKGEKEIAGVGISFEEKTAVFIKQGGFLTEGYLKDKLQELSKKTSLAAFDIKKQYDFLQKENTDGYFDVLIGAYLLNPLKSDYQIEDIAGEHLNLILESRQELFGKKKLSEAVLEEEAFLKYAGLFVYAVWKAKVCIEEKLEEQGMYRLFREVEMPLSLVLYDMEQEGVLVRPEELKEYGESLVGKIQELEKQIYKLADTEFNINSPKQLGEILFERLQIPGGKKTKTGYSTAADVLEKLAPDYPIVAAVLEYRGLAKLKSTYADGLAVFIDENNRIHSNFNQTITATGRISSTEPNLQNIPMRMELGRMIRKVFVPKDGYLFMDADYSQIELRVLAHMSGDEQLIEAYRMDEDIHKITAAKVFHTPLEEVTDLQRRNAKAVNFGIVYGISSFGLSQDLSITRKEATAYIEQYFATYPRVKEFLDKLVSDAKEKGYAETMFGRRRPVPELSSGNFMQRSFGERIAMNSPIQGTAADIIKIAMLHVWQKLKEEKLKSKLILQVHDELLIEVLPEEEERVREILTNEMQSAADLLVTLEIDLHTGKNWYEAK
ncbi:MAG: DNA polymerase I [Lachnospiraceae bacterium]|nr:DNA polymerase I [Lachnospiraceae bacterium]